MLEVPKGTSTAALYLELGILPIHFEIEIKQLLYLKRILDKKNDDPVQLCYREMLKFSEEANWANDVIGLRKRYSLPLRDDNVKNMGVKDSKWIVQSTIYREVFWELKAECNSNKTTSHIIYKRFGTSDYLLKLSPELARLVFKAKTRMFDMKSNYKRKYRSVLTCPFCMVQDETFDNLFACPNGIVVPNILQGATFNSFSSTDLNFIESLGKFLQRYQQYHEILM